MPDKRDSKHPGLFLKRSLSIEDIGEKKALVFDSDSKQSFILNSSAYYFLMLCNGSPYNLIKSEYVQYNRSLLDNPEVLERDADSLYCQLKAIGLIEECVDE